MAENFPCGIIWSVTSLFVEIEIKFLLNILFSIKSPSRPTLRTSEQPAVLGQPPSDPFTQVKIMRIWWRWSAVYSTGLFRSPEHTESLSSVRREVTTIVIKFQPEVMEHSWEEILNLQEEKSLRYWLVSKVKKIKIYQIQYLVFFNRWFKNRKILLNCNNCKCKKSHCTKISITRALRLWDEPVDMEV